jgi:MFS family permease
MGVAAAVLGTIESVAYGFSAVAKLYGGWWTDRVRRRKPLCAGGYAAMAVATGVIATAVSWPTVLIGRTSAWFSRGLRTPPRKALLAQAVTPATYGRAFGFERMMDTLGAVIAPLATLALLQTGWSHRGLMWISVVPALLAAVSIIMLVRETSDHVPSPHPIVASVRVHPRI